MALNYSFEEFRYFNCSDFSDIYFKTLVAVRNMPILLSSKSSVCFFGIVIFIVMMITYILQFTTELKGDQNKVENSVYIFSKDELIMDIERALVELHQASDKCYNKNYFLKCIELSIYWPTLINISLPNSKGITPFHRVCYRGHYSLIDFMLTKGANPLQETESGENAFHMVIDYYIRNPIQKNFNCLDLLYENGGFLEKGDEWYKQFVSDARKFENEALEKWLSTHIISATK